MQTKTELAGCRVFPLNGETMKEVVPGALYMNVMLGHSFSVALLKFIEQKEETPNVSAKPHSHGEEVTLVLDGGATMFMAHGEFEIHKDDIIVTPPRVPHGGTNLFGVSGD